MTTNTINLEQRHLASECDAEDGRRPRGTAACGAWYDTKCVWCGAEIHMHRRQYGKEVQTCSARCRVARHRDNKASA